MLDVAPLGASFNAMYYVRARQGDYALRMGPPRQVHLPGAAQAELEWTALLGAPAPQVVTARDGAASVRAPGTAGECMLLTWLPGRTLARPPTARDASELAAMAAELHAAPEPATSRPPGVLDASRALLFEVEDVLPAEFGPALQRAQAALDRLPTTGSPHRPSRPRRLHGDLTPSNALRIDGGLAVLDFQDLMWGYVAQDIAHTVHALAPHGDQLVTTFLARYAELAAEPADLTALPDLLMARRLSVANLSLVMGRPRADVLARHGPAVARYMRT